MLADQHELLIPNEGQNLELALVQHGTVATQSLSIWSDPELPLPAHPTYKRRRQPEFSDSAILVCLTIKVLFGVPPRQTTGFVERFPRLEGLDWKVPDFNTLRGRRRQ